MGRPRPFHVDIIDLCALLESNQSIRAEMKCEKWFLVESNHIRLKYKRGFFLDRGLLIALSSPPARYITLFCFLNNGIPQKVSEFNFDYYFCFNEWHEPREWCTAIKYVIVTMMILSMGYKWNYTFARSCDLYILFNWKITNNKIQGYCEFKEHGKKGVSSFVWHEIKRKRNKKRGTIVRELICIYRCIIFF